MSMKHLEAVLSQTRTMASGTQWRGVGPQAQFLMTAQRMPVEMGQIVFK